MKRLIFTLFLIPISLFSLLAQPEYMPSDQNIKNRIWFEDAKFGLFIHWGVYCLMAGAGDEGIAEWIMQQKEIPIKQYEKLPGFFNPSDFNPADWVSMVKNAGMKYITITSKHHDGFAMFDSEVSNYNVVEKTPYGKDILKELKNECDKQNIKLFFYYSQLDWHHPDYYPRGGTGKGYTGRPESGDWDNYLNYMNAQLTELLSNYGEVGGIWFDGMWDKKEANWQLNKTYQLIHKLQPGALIGSNHHLTPIPGEDFQMFERDLPGENTMGFNQTGTISDLPLEMCETMNGSWGFNLIDQNYKSSKQLIHTLIKAAGFGANFLLNTGPMPNGKIQPENIDTLKVMGTWLAQNGESIYGTRKGPFLPQNWGASTAKGNIIYIHIIDCKNEKVQIPTLPSIIKDATLLNTEIKVKFTKNDEGYLLRIPTENQDPIDTIIKLEL